MVTAHIWKEPSGRRSFPTVGARLFWSYSNLAMAHAALRHGATKYSAFPYFQIRAKLFAGLTSGTSRPGSLFDDVRLQLLAPAACAYCGSGNPDTVDHVLPRTKGGADTGENLVPCCRRCNSAKGTKDVMVWHRGNSSFPSLAVTRRYLKLAIAAAVAREALETLLTDVPSGGLGFDPCAIPMNYPLPKNLVWAMGTPPVQ